MYKIPLTNSPNQTFSTAVPVNGENKDFTFVLNYNEQAQYWSMTLMDSLTNEILFSQLPMLFSFFEFANMITQLSYKQIGSIYICPVQETQSSAPNDKDIGQKYILVWGDNE